MRANWKRRTALPCGATHVERGGEIAGYCGRRDTVKKRQPESPHTEGENQPAQRPYLYRTSGSHKPIPGNTYSSTRATICIPMNGIMPAKIWLSVT